MRRPEESASTSTVPAQCTVHIIPETEPVEFFFWYDVSECATSITTVDLNSDLTFLIQSGEILDPDAVSAMLALHDYWTAENERKIDPTNEQHLRSGPLLSTSKYTSILRSLGV